MALHGKKYPGPKNYTSKYPTKKHNPKHDAVINIFQRRSGTPTALGKQSFNTITGEITGQRHGGLPVRGIEAPRPGPGPGEPGGPPSLTSGIEAPFSPGPFGARAPQPVARKLPGRRVGRNTSPGTPRRVGAFRPSFFPTSSPKPLARRKKRKKRR